MQKRYLNCNLLIISHRDFISFSMTFEVYKKKKYHTIYSLENIIVFYFFYSWLQTNQNCQDISKSSELEAWNVSYEFLIFLSWDRISSVLLSIYMPHIKINICMLHQFFFLSCRLLFHFHNRSYFFSSLFEFFPTVCPVSKITSSVIFVSYGRSFYWLHQYFYE